MTYRVLIADDEPNIVLSLEFLMTQRGYQTRVAHDGEQALAAVEEFRPDLVLLDVMMPKLDGYAVCATAARRRPHGREDHHVDGEGPRHRGREGPGRGS